MNRDTEAWAIERLRAEGPPVAPFPPQGPGYHDNAPTDRGLWEKYLGDELTYLRLVSQWLPEVSEWLRKFDDPGFQWYAKLDECGLSLYYNVLPGKLPVDLHGHRLLAGWSREKYFRRYARGGGHVVAIKRPDDNFVWTLDLIPVGRQTSKTGFWTEMGGWFTWSGKSRMGKNRVVAYPLTPWTMAAVDGSQGPNGEPLRDPRTEGLRELAMAQLTRVWAGIWKPGDPPPEWYRQ